MKLLHASLLLCALSMLLSAHDNHLKINSEIDGLFVEINEVPRGVLKEFHEQEFVIKEDVGTGGFGFHRVVLHKEINATHEYFSQKEFRYKPFEPIIVTKSKLQPQLKKTLLAQQNGLHHTLNLKHHYASHLEIDDDFIYVLTQARTQVYSKKKREKYNAEYLEIYDKKTFSLVKEILLNQDDEDSFDRDILLHQGYLYVSSKNGNVIFWKKEEGFNQPPSILSTPTKGLNKLRSYGDYLFRFGREGIVEVYHTNLHVKTIDTKEHRFNGYELLEDKRFDRIFDLLYAHKRLFIANDLGDVHVYAFDSHLKTSSYLTILRDTTLKDTYDVLDLALYDASTLLVGTDGHGIYAYDTVTLKPLFHTSILPKKSSIQHIEVTKETLLFTQGYDTPVVYAYDMKERKNVHSFEGEARGVNDFKINDAYLYWLDDGCVYIFKMAKPIPKQKNQ